MYFYSPGLCFFIVLPRFFQIFSIFLFIFISKRHNPWDILFLFFSQFFSLSGLFFFDFFILQTRLHIFCFLSIYLISLYFFVFMVLIFFSRCHVFYPLFHLSGLPFSFFVNNLTFSLLSTFFIPSLRFLSLIAISHHFLAFHCLSLPFLFFSPMSILHFPLFSRFLPFLNSFLSFLLFPPLPSFYTLFLPFF